MRSVSEYVLTDSHAHICSYGDLEMAVKEIKYRKTNGIFTCFSTGTPEQWQDMQRILQAAGAGEEEAEISFGIHPWYADQWNPRDWMDIYQSCRIIGEIGMDSLWCQVPLKRQQEVLEEQLQMAADLRKPVVLHTKDCEAEIAEIIKGFPCPVLVHWYSGNEKTLTRYMEQGCWFTLGPDTCLKDRSLLLEQVSGDRILLETDGLEAVKWAYAEHGLSEPGNGLSLIGETLMAGAAAFARRFETDMATAKKTTGRNYLTFAGRI